MPYLKYTYDTISANNKLDITVHLLIVLHAEPGNKYLT